MNTKERGGESLGKKGYWLQHRAHTLALVVNAAAVVYQFSVIRKNKLNPFKDELYKDKAFYKKINAENK